MHSNKVYTSNLEVTDMTLAGNISFDSGTTCHYKYVSTFNCNLFASGGSIQTVNLYFYDSGYYKFACVIDGTINDI
jgi:hypothetical protein